MSFDASRIKKNRRNCESHQQTFLQREMKRKKNREKEYYGSKKIEHQYE